MNTSSVDADNGDTTLRLYFAKGPTLKDWVSRLGWKWLLRHPLTLWEILGTEFIGFMWKSDARHVLIGQLGGVLDYQYCKIQYYPQGNFEQTYPGLIGWFDIPHSRWANLNYFTKDHQPHWRRALVTSLKYYGMFFTFGMYQPKTCVTVAAEILHDANVKVPRNVWAPPRLAWWLMETGHAFVPANPAAQRRSTDRRTRRGDRPGEDRRSFD